MNDENIEHAKLLELLESRRVRSDPRKRLEQVKAWAEAEEKAWAERNDPEKQWRVVSMTKFSANNPPEWFQREMEAQYRKGFQYGVMESSRHVRRLYRKGGYVRPSEIANILFDWAQTTLRKWRSGAQKEQPLVGFGEPRLVCKSWHKIKKEVHERDGNACLECGSTENLEAHHVDPVKDGGGPYLDNLITLCKSCHRG